MEFHSDVENPYATPVPTETIVWKPARRRGWVLKFTLGLAGLMLVGTVPATVFAWWEIETIVGSGPIYAIASLVLVVFAMITKRPSLLLIALPTLCFAIGVFLTIWIKHWSPGQAHFPISSAIACFSVVIQLGWFVIRSAYGVAGKPAESSSLPDAPHSAPFEAWDIKISDPPKWP